MCEVCKLLCMKFQTSYIFLCKTFNYITYFCCFLNSINLVRRYTPFLIVFFTLAILLLLSFVPTEFTLLDHKFRKVDVTAQLKEIFLPKDSKLISKDTLKVPHLYIDSLLALTLNLNLDSILEQEKNDLRISSFATNTILFSKFFHALRSVRDSSSRTRVAYFGDSMIEGDLISQSLRNELQNKVGGRGVGFVPITSIVSQFRRTIKHDFSDDWKCFSIQKNKESKNYAPSGFVFNPRILTSIEIKDTITKQKVSYVHYAAPTDSYSRLSQLYTTKLYYGKPSKGAYIKYYIDGKSNKSLLNGQSNVNELILNHSLPYKEILIEFYTDTVLDVYGVSFESPSGVFVDNYAVRGSSGMPLQKIPENILHGFNSTMNYSLLIFQFGLNVAAPEARGFKWYEDAMVKVVDYYKKIFPNADILIVSIGDKSYKHNMEYVTQPGIPKLVESQRNVAKRTQSHFWNLYQSMGGFNSMKSWVESPRPLASKDYAHINFSGAEKISKLLSDNVLNEYKLYQYNLLKDKEKQNLIAALLNSNSFLTDNFSGFDKQYAFLYNNKMKVKTEEKSNINTEQVINSEVKKDSAIAISSDTTFDNYEYRIQIGASKTELDEHIYDDILNKAKDKKLLKIIGKDGFYRYYISPFNNFDNAQAFTDTLYADIKDAFVVGFINGKISKIEKVKAIELEVKNKKHSQSENISSKNNETKTVIKSGKSLKVIPKNNTLKKDEKPSKVMNFADVYHRNTFAKVTLPDYIHQLKISETNKMKLINSEEMPVFRVLFCASEIELDKSFYQNIIDYFGDSLIIISKDKDGLIKYSLGDYKTFEEAEKALKKVFELKQDGYITAFQNNKRIKNEEAIAIIKKMKK